MNNFTTVLLGAVSGTLLASFGTALKSIPVNIYYFFKRQFTVTTTIRSGYYMHYLVENYIQDNYDIGQFRILKGSADDKLMMGWSTFIIKFNGKRLLVTSFEDRQAHKANNDTQGISYFIITTFGRKHELINSFIKACDEYTRNDYKGYIKTMSYDCTHNTLQVSKVHTRSIESVIINKKSKDTLLEQIKWFLNNEEFYRKNSIPYRLGIMLYGPPGTGKTSLIKALATEFNLPINNITGLSDMTRLAVEQNTFNVIEDIDSYQISKDREKENEQILIKEKEFNIANVLNVLDGLTSKDNYIIIATTNHLNKLDEALIRPGRFDIKIELGYVDMEMLKDFLCKHFDESEINSINFSEYTIRNNIAASLLQQLILERLSLVDILNKVCMNSEGSICV